MPIAGVPLFKVSGYNTAIDIQPSTQKQKTGRTDDRRGMDHGWRDNEPTSARLFSTCDEPRYQKVLLQHGLVVRDIFVDGQLLPAHAGYVVRVRQDFVRYCEQAQKSRDQRSGERPTTSSNHGENYFIDEHKRYVCL